MTQSVKTNWSVEDELVLKEWTDKAACYKWLHEKAYNNYSCSYLSFTIPVIIISTITGASNFALERVPEPYRSYCSVGIGSFNILAGIITTISQFMKIGEMVGGHAVTKKNWDKFHRGLKLEASKRPEDRADKKEFLELAKKEFDRLIESSPDIPPRIITAFRKQFKDSHDLIKPEICGEIIPVEIYQTKEIASNSKIEEFIKHFKNKYNRPPSEEDIEQVLV